MTRQELLKQIVIWQHGAEATPAQIKRVVDSRRTQTDAELQDEVNEIQWQRSRQAALLHDDMGWREC